VRRIKGKAKLDGAVGWRLGDALGTKSWKNRWVLEFFGHQNMG
jgi:hypothetical protein